MSNVLIRNIAKVSEGWIWNFIENITYCTVTKHKIKLRFARISQFAITNQSWRHVFFWYEIYMKLKCAWFEMKIHMANTGTRRFKHIMSVQIDYKDDPSFKTYAICSLYLYGYWGGILLNYLESNQGTKTSCVTCVTYWTIQNLQFSV